MEKSGQENREPTAAHRGTTRREFVKKALISAPALAEAAATLRASGSPRVLAGDDALDQAATSQTPGEPRIFMEPFNYEGVRLLDGRLKNQYTTARDYFYAIPSNDMLRGFRMRAGLGAPGNDLGGWYSGDTHARTWWSDGDTFSVFGQWLSGMARMGKATGDEAMGIKAAHLMIEWGRAMDSDGYFYYSRRPIHPHYTYEKTVCGLVDLYEFGGRQDALPLLEKITDWAIPRLDRERKPDSGTEWYTLSENLYRAYKLTGNPKYKTYGDVWRFDAYWKSFTGGTELTRHNHHAYSHVNTLNSAAMTYAVTGDPEYLSVITNAFDWLEKTQLYATGGYGPDERLLPPDGSLGESLATTFRSFETPCGSWAAFKLARYLMRFTGEAKYGDWMERLIYNGIGAALPMGPNGQTFYYSDYRLGGGRKIYHLDGAWPCCSGTITQALADYHNIIYYKDPSALYVNLFVPSSVSWNHDGTEVYLEQETAFPEADTTSLTIRTSAKAAFDLKFRVPRWTDGVTVKVNGVDQKIACQPASWATIQRTWTTGDRVTIHLPMRFALVPIDAQHPNRVAVMYGPVVLVRDQAPTIQLRGNDISNWLSPASQPPEFSESARANGSFVPFYSTGLNAPYNMYFDVNEKL
jgi:uncharacterized protein